MDVKRGLGCALAVLFALVLLCGTQARAAKKGDGGKAEKFKKKTFKLKEGRKGKVTLSFPAGKTFDVKVRSTGKPDVNLFIYDAAKKEVAKDDSPGPDCDIEFTPKKAGKYTLEVVNKGPKSTTSTLTVTLKKKKPKPEE